MLVQLVQEAAGPLPVQMQILLLVDHKPITDGVAYASYCTFLNFNFLLYHLLEDFFYRFVVLYFE